MKHRTCIVSIILMVMGCGTEVAAPTDSPRVEAKQSTSPAPVAHALPDLTEAAFKATGLPDNRAGRAIFAYLRAAFTPPSGANELLQATGALRQNSAEVLQTLRDTYARLPETDFRGRWNMVFVMGQLRDLSALAQLETIVRSAIPPERFARTGHDQGGSEAEELRIRIAAADGIANMARDGKPEAVQALRGLIRPELPRAVRDVAVSAYLELGNADAQREDLARVLAPGDQWMLARHAAAPARTPLAPARKSSTR